MSAPGADAGLEYRGFVRSLFDRWKRKDPWSPACSLPVFGADGRVLASLRPVTADHRESAPYLAELLGRWREENPSLAPTVFKVTPERTLRWLDKVIIGRDDKLLFMLHGTDGAPLGHLGYSNFDFDARSAEVDSILRGVKEGYPGLMHFAMAALMRWGFQELQVREIRLSVLSDNARAIAFYERLGFVREGLKPLVRTVLPDEERWDPAPEGFSGPADRYFQYMRLDPQASPPPVREAFELYHAARGGKR